MQQSRRAPLFETLEDTLTALDEFVSELNENSDPLALEAYLRQISETQAKLMILTGKDRVPNFTFLVNKLSG